MDLCRHPTVSSPSGYENRRGSTQQLQHQNLISKKLGQKKQSRGALPDPRSGILPADTQGILMVLWSYFQQRAGKHYPHGRDWKTGDLPDSASTFAQCCPSPLFTQFPLTFPLTLPQPPSRERQACGTTPGSCEHTSGNFSTTLMRRRVLKKFKVQET